MENLFALAIAAAILVVIPGPNVALIVANSLRYSLGMGTLTALGTTAGVGLQLLLVVIGLADVVEYAADALTWVRWAAVNPKTLVFNAAFLPQFVPADTASGAQFAAVAVVFLAVLLVGDLLWAAFASSARRLLSRYGEARNRLTGGFLVLAGVGLALTRK